MEAEIGVLFLYYGLLSLLIGSVAISFDFIANELFLRKFLYLVGLTIFLFVTALPIFPMTFVSCNPGFKISVDFFMHS